MCTNGYITFEHDNSVDGLRLPYKHTVLFIYGVDLYATKDPIWYRTTNNASILNRADEDIRKISKDNFTSKYAVIITFVNIPYFPESKNKQTFQAVLASDYSQTYIILNYLQLTVQGTAGLQLIENVCNLNETKTFVEFERSRCLTETSNIGIKGRHVHLLPSEICEGNL